MTAILLGSGMFSQYYDQALHWIYRLDRQAWFLILCGVLLLGALCLRGFGSRTHY